MKFKKSYVLISLISIFLLLSLTAVSAADDMDNQLPDNSAVEVIDDVDEVEDTNDNYLTNSNILSDGDSTDVGNESGDPVEEKIPTTIEAEDHSYIFGDDLQINFTVNDNNDKIINFTKENLKILNESDEPYNFTITQAPGVEKPHVTLDNLFAGNYTLHIMFLGNDTYSASEKTIALTIDKTETQIVANASSAKVGDKITIPITIKCGSNFNKTYNYNYQNFTVLYGEQVINVTAKVNITENGTVKGIAISNFTNEPGEYALTIKFLGSQSCNPSETTVTVKILANTTIKANDTIKVNQNSKNVTVPIVISYSNGTNVTNLNVTKDDLKVYLKTNGETIEITDYNLNNSTIGFVNENIQDKSQLVIVYKEGSLDEANKTINITTYINAKIEAQNVVVDYQSGNFTFLLKDADTGAVLPNTNVTISGVYFFSNVNGTSARPSETFTSDANGLIFLDNVNLNKGIDFSFFVYNFTTLDAGKYNLTFKGNSSMELNQNVEITVNAVKAKIVADNYNEYVGSTKKFTFKLVNAATNQVLKLVSMQFKVKIGSATNTYNATTNLTGEASFNVNLQAGTYPVTILTNSANVVKTTLDRTIKINKKPGVLAANNRTIKYGSDPTAIIKFTDKNTGKAIVGGIVKVRLYTTSKKYVDLAFRTNKTGHVQFSAALSVGKHKMIISSLDNNYTASSITRYVTVKKTTGKFSASKVTTYYRSGKLYKIKVINTKNNKAMYGAKVLIKVYTSKKKYYRYDGTTAGNGIVQFKINYIPGTYKVVISSNDKGYTAKSVTKQIKVTKAPIKMTPTSLKVKKGKTFKVKVTSTKSKKVISGVKVKVKVYTGKKYKTYTIKTNKKGIASLKITQKVGKHKIVLSPGLPSRYSAKALTKTLKVTK